MLNFDIPNSCEHVNGAVSSETPNDVHVAPM